MTWGIKEEWSYYMANKAPVYIVKDESADTEQWSVDVQATWADKEGPMTLNCTSSLQEAIDFCKENSLSYKVLDSYSNLSN